MFFGLLLIPLYLSYFFLDEKVFKNSRQNDASALSFASFWSSKRKNKK
jgi:hypothetical protein